MKKRLISFLLSMSVIASVIPTTIYAADTENEKISITASTENSINVVETSTSPETPGPEMPDLETGIFTRSYYYLYVERDYSQYRTIEVSNTTPYDKEFYLTCVNVPDDLAIDFIKGGSKSEPVLLKAGETREVELAVFAQNAIEEDNQFDIYAYEIGKDGDIPTSQATVYLNVNIPIFDISTVLVSEDSNTLAKTYRVTNNDDNDIADLTVSVDESLENYAYFDTYIENYALEAGQSIEFVVKPDLKKMKERDLSKLDGNIVISGSGQSEDVSVVFDTDGKEIISDSMHNIALIQDNNPFVNMTIDNNSIEVSEDSYASENGFELSVNYDTTYGENNEKTINNNMVITGNVIDVKDGIDDNIELTNDGGVVKVSISYILSAKEYKELYESIESQDPSVALMFTNPDIIEDDFDNDLGMHINLLMEFIGSIFEEVSAASSIMQIVEAFGTVDDINDIKYVMSIPDLPQKYKDDYLFYSALNIAATAANTILLFAPEGVATKIFAVLGILESWALGNKINKIKQEIIDYMKEHGYDFNEGYKKFMMTEGSQCTNRGSISSDFYVPNYISNPTPTPTATPTPEPVMPQLESPQADVPSSTVEPGTIVTLTGPDKGSVYYSLDNGEYIEYTEPIVINDSTVLKIRTQSNEEYPMYSDSDTVTYVYTIEGQLFAPVPSPENTIVESGESIELIANEGETIFYAIDDNLEDDFIPTEDSYIEYAEPIVITKDCVIYTFAQREGYKSSRIAQIPAGVIFQPTVEDINSRNSVSLYNNDSAEEGIRLFYTGRMFGGGYVNSQVTNYKYLLNGNEVATGTNSGLTEVNIAEISTDNLRVGQINSFVRDYDTNPGSHSVSTDNAFTLIYPSDSIICYVGDIDSFPDVRLRPDFAVYDENIYSDQNLIIEQPNKIKVNYYNRGSQSGFYTINLYVNDSLVSSKENQFMRYFSSGSMEFDFTPTEYNNNVKVEIVNEMVDLAEEASDNNMAEHSFTARDPEVPSIDELSPNADAEQAETQTLSATITKNADVAEVVFSVDGNVIEGEVSSSGTRYWINTAESLSLGEHMLSVKVTDIFGNEYSKEQAFNVIEPINRYENYHFYYMQYKIYVKPNAEFNLNDYIGVVDDEYTEFKTLDDFKEDIVITPGSGLTSNINDPFMLTAQDEGEFNIQLTLGENEEEVTIYCSASEIQSCTYNINADTGSHWYVDVYHKDEDGWSSFWDYDELHDPENKTVQVVIYPEDFTTAEDYKVILRGSNYFFVEDFVNGTVDVAVDDLAEISIEDNEDITDVSCTVYYNFDEENSVCVGGIYTDDDGNRNKLLVHPGQYNISSSFAYGNDYYSSVEKDIDLTNENFAEIDLLSLLNYAVVDLSAIDVSDNVYMYAVDEYGCNYINQVKIDEGKYNVILDDDMIENIDNYKLFIVDGDNFYFEPLSKDTMIVEIPETSMLSFTKAENITIDSVTLNSIDGIEYTVPLEYEDNNSIELPKGKYTLGVQFKVDETNVYKEYEADLSLEDAVINLDEAAAETNFIVAWSEQYDNQANISIYGNDMSISAEYTNNTGTTLADGTYNWSLNLTRGRLRYTVTNTSEVTSDEVTNIMVGTKFNGLLSPIDTDTEYETNEQISLVLSDIKDENGNVLEYCRGANSLNAKLVYTNVKDETDIREIPLDISSISNGGTIYANLPDKAGTYNIQLIVEGERVSSPVASVESGEYRNNVKVELSSDNEDAEIYYTTDGSDPTTDSSKYTGRITISSSCILKAIAVVGNDVSPVATYEYTIIRPSNTGGGGSGTVRYTITISYIDDDGNIVDTFKISDRYGTTITEEQLTIPEGYNLEDNSFSHRITKNETVEVQVARSQFEDEVMTEEKPFISGYGNREFRPDNSITRAEVATIIYNMLNDTDEDYTTITSRFSDIPNSHWAYEMIGFNLANNYMNGDSGSNTFRPDDDMTRAELAQMLFNLDMASSSGSSVSFSDISGHWGENAIIEMAKADVINGYGDNTFRPNNNVTRAEAVAMISRLFKRSNEWTGNITFSDVSTNHWAYSIIMNAANGNVS